MLWACFVGSRFADDLVDAVATADEDLEHAHRYADRSAMIAPLTIYALVLRTRGGAETAAIVRGRLPRRFTVLLVAQLADLDRGLDEQLEPDRRAELMARGRNMDPLQLQTLMHTVAARHLSI